MKLWMTALAVGMLAIWRVRFRRAVEQTGV